jgi:hypothetical protein
MNEPSPHPSPKEGVSQVSAEQWVKDWRAATGHEHAIEHDEAPHKSGTIQLVSSFLEQGMAPGAAPAFLVAGPATSIPPLTALGMIVRLLVVTAYIVGGQGWKRSRYDYSKRQRSLREPRGRVRRWRSRMQ